MDWFVLSFPDKAECDGGVLVVNGQSLVLGAFPTISDDGFVFQATVERPERLMEIELRIPVEVWRGTHNSEVGGYGGGLGFGYNGVARLRVMESYDSEPDIVMTALLPNDPETISMMRCTEQKLAVQPWARWFAYVPGAGALLGQLPKALVENSNDR